MIPVIRSAFQAQRRFAVVRLLDPLATRIRFVGDRATLVTVSTSLTITVIAVDIARSPRRIHRNLRIVDAQTITLRIPVREESPLQHPVWREADSRYDVRRRECSLLDIRKMVVGVSIEFHLANFDQRIIRLRPYLREVERIDAVRTRLLLGHDLHEQRPAREIFALDALIQ